MSRKKQGREFSAWAGTNQGVNAHLAPAEPPEEVEIGGSPVIDQSHEYVIRRNAPDSIEAECTRTTRVVPRAKGSAG